MESASIDAQFRSIELPSPGDGCGSLDLIVQEVHLTHDPDWTSLCTSRSIRLLRERADRFALAADPVLIVGECATGKHQLARRIHRQISSSSSRLVRIACGKLGPAVSPATGAQRPWYELFQRARRETDIVWWFDRIDEIPSTHQSLVSGLVDEILRHTPLHQWPNIISTTRPQLADAVAKGTFREELYYKLGVLELSIPPLRERGEDIPLLLEHFLNLTHRTSTGALRFTKDAVAVLNEYEWPGNLIELRNVVAKVAVLSERSVIDAKYLLSLWQPSKRTSRQDLVGLKLEDAETQLILQAIARCDGNKTAAAKQLGITARTLHNKIQKYRALGYVD